LSKEPSLENVMAFLEHAPGKPCLKQFANTDKPVKTLVITGTDSDLLIPNSQYALRTDINDIKIGIKVIKEITGVERIVIAAPVTMMQDAMSAGVEVAAVELDYPAANHRLIAGNIMGETFPAGETFENAGICFLSAEAVAAIGCAHNTGRIPTKKVLTVIKKSGEKVLVIARIGTMLKDVFKKLDITLDAKDRIIIGGPMTGSSIYSEGYPVCPDTEAVMIQGSADIYDVSDAACINCGECVRICPAQVPVNLLVRYLEAGQYQDAVDLCDLDSCIECGLCSLVCTAKIPIFQYIRLAKYELARTAAAEENNE